MVLAADAPPPELLFELAGLKSALDDAIPAKRLDRNLIVATWNIRHFGDLTEKWRAEPDDSPKRDLFALQCIREIVARFDVVAIQEVRDNIKCLRRLLNSLGPEWGMIMTDVTRGTRGNYERMAFLFDTRRVRPSGLACELVVPEEWIQTETIAPDALRRQFARTPYAVSFVAGGETFILVTLHVIYGEGSAERLPELGGIATWMSEWAARERSWGHNLIALGDFNIDRLDDPNWQAFTSTGLRAPPELEALPRTIFASGADKFYDQIAWFTGEGGVPMLSLTYGGRGGNFDFVGQVLADLTPTELSWKLSDHYPMWVEFTLGA